MHWTSEFVFGGLSMSHTILLANLLVHGPLGSAEAEAAIARPNEPTRSKKGKKGHLVERAAVAYGLIPALTNRGLVEHHYPTLQGPAPVFERYSQTTFTITEAGVEALKLLLNKYSELAALCSTALAAADKK